MTPARLFGHSLSVARRCLMLGNTLRPFSDIAQHASSCPCVCFSAVVCFHASWEPDPCSGQGARSIVAKEGMGGLYSGLLPTLLRDVPEIAIQVSGDCAEPGQPRACRRGACACIALA